jgi:hypothetical protein
LFHWQHHWILAAYKVAACTAEQVGLTIYCTSSFFSALPFGLGSSFGGARTITGSPALSNRSKMLSCFNSCGLS